MSDSSGDGFSNFFKFLPEEHQIIADPNSPVRSERNLIAAVLARSVCDAFGGAKCERHIIRDARQWIFRKLTPKKAFSFAWCALQLDLNPVDLQIKLRNASIEEMRHKIEILRS